MIRYFASYLCLEPDQKNPVKFFPCHTFFILKRRPPFRSSAPILPPARRVPIHASRPLLRDLCDSFLCDLCVNSCPSHSCALFTLCEDDSQKSEIPTLSFQSHTESFFPFCTLKQISALVSHSSEKWVGEGGTKPL